MRIAAGAFVLVLMLGLAGGCEKANDGNGDVVASDSQVAADVDGVGADATGEVFLPVCPDEADLAGLLPCDCYGMVATDPAAQVPGCITRVVCCPTIRALRCEDHELLAEPTPEVVEEVAVDVTVEADAASLVDVAVEPVLETVTETAEEATPTPVCPNEVDLSAYTPCTCKGVLVRDVHDAMPACTKKVVCCPYDGLKCE